MAAISFTEPEVKATAFLFFFLIPIHIVAVLYFWWNYIYFDFTIFSYHCGSIFYVTLTCTFLLGLYITRRIAAGGKFEYIDLKDGKIAVFLRSGRRVEIKVKDKVVMITGGNTGIGYQTALHFATWQAKVVILCRDEKRATSAVNSLRRKSKNNNVQYKPLDLASFESIRSFVSSWAAENNSPIDILINNAGIMMTPFGLTKDGFEQQFGVNHLGHFLLTKLLIPYMNQDEGRIINLSSFAHTFAPEATTIDWLNLDDRSKVLYQPQLAYGVSKLANIYFTRKLQLVLRKQNTQINTYAVHPGGVNTELIRHFPRFLTLLLSPIMLLIFKTPKEGCQTTLFCALHPDAVPAEYYSDCRLGFQTKQTLDETEWDRLWEASETLCSR